MGAICLAVTGSGILLVNSCSTSSTSGFSAPDIPGATFVGNKACADCHKGITRIFPTNAHVRIQSGFALFLPSRQIPRGGPALPPVTSHLQAR